MTELACKIGSWRLSSTSSSSAQQERAFNRCCSDRITSRSSGISSFLGRKVACTPFENYQLARSNQKHNNGTQRRLNTGNCRAALPDDAPFAMAIGASILSTLVLPVTIERDNTQEESLFGPDDVLSGAMQIISFIPLFNWLVWVFAWLDTRQPRYLAFVAVYLAPYLKTGLSLSPEDSWLPVASVLACIVHVQLDLSVTAEGAESPIGDLSKLLKEKTNVKDLRGRTDGLVNRLKALAEKSDTNPIDTAVQKDDQAGEADWIAMQKEAQENEFAAWDEKLSKSVKEAVKDIDS